MTGKASQTCSASFSLPSSLLSSQKLHYAESSMKLKMVWVYERGTGRFSPKLLTSFSVRDSSSKRVQTPGTMSAQLHIRLFKKESCDLLPAVQVSRNETEPSLFVGGERLRSGPGTVGFTALLGWRTRLKSSHVVVLERLSPAEFGIPAVTHCGAATLHPSIYSQTLSRHEMEIKTATAHE